MISLELRVDTAATQQMLREAPSRLKRAIVRGLRRGSEVVVKQAKLNLKANRSVASGLLSNSLWYMISEPLLYSVIGPGTGGKARVDITGDAVNYGRFVERGRRPGGFPDPRILDWWIRRKLGKDPNSPVNRGPNAGKGTLRFAIADKIAKRGFAARPFLEPALTKNVPAIQEAFAAEIRREVQAFRGRGRR